MKNKYEIRGDVTAIFIESPTRGLFETLISTSELERVKNYPYSWTIRNEKKTGNFYVRTSIYLDKKKTEVSLHRFITGASKGLVVDHMNHNGLDNTNENLRVVTQGENMQNRKSAQSNSFTGVRGVSEYKAKGKYKRNKKYVVRVGIGSRKQKTVGYYNSLEEANQAAIRFRMELMPYSKG